MATAIITAIGVVASLIALYEFFEPMVNNRFTWRQVNRLILKVIDDIRNDQFTPDVIMGVGRGGSIVAAMLAGNMNKTPFVCVDTISREVDGDTVVVMRHPEAVLDLKDKAVLVVVGELFSGEDLKEGRRFAETFGPRVVKTLSLVTQKASSTKPTFYGKATKNALSAPWRLTTEYKEARI